jgi:glycosyltransferase involved in cell wall biosynthesis
MVITEAMARGLPVIASHSSAGPDLIVHKHDGLIINSGDIDDLTEKMNWCLMNREALTEMAKQALIKAKSYQWADYRKELILKISAQLHCQRF